MADGFRSKATAPGAEFLDAGYVNGGPPPSTLAAQLVENISPTAKSTRSDENSELKGFFAVIQRVKDDADALKTPAERVGHNHMLIYVYSRVVLANIKLNDLSLDQSQVRIEALKAINFLRFTIKETPSVLVYSTDPEEYLFRGQEPLWIWLLPQLLRLLGYSQTLDLDEAIEGFLEFLLLTVARNGALWELGTTLGVYLRACISSLLDLLQKPSIVPSHTKVPTRLSLPTSAAIDEILGKGAAYTTKAINYDVTHSSQALKQVSSLTRVLGYPLLSRDPVFAYLLPWQENSFWLLDVVLDLRHAYKRWETSFNHRPVTLIGIALSIISSVYGQTEGDKAFRNKAHALLILLCGDMIVSPGELVSEDDSGNRARVIYCKALVAIADSSLEHRPTGRLAESKLVNELLLLSTQYVAIGQDTDIWRCTSLLKTMINSDPSTTSYADTVDFYPSNFDDIEVQQCVEVLGISFHASDQGEAPTKRQKLDDASATKSYLAPKLLRSALQIEYIDDALSEAEPTILDTFPSVDERGRCLAIDALSLLCCEIDGALWMNSPQDASRRVLRCSVCDADAELPQSTISESLQHNVREIFTKLTQLPSFLESRRSRVVAMMALRRLAQHCQDPDFINLETSTLGQWCLQSLNSSIRELRIASGRTLMAFMQPKMSYTLGDELVRRNRHNTIGLLKSISEKHRPQLVETCVMTWGQLGKVVKESELNLVLLQLLDYLGSSNNVVSAFAFNELINLAEGRKTTPRRLLEPYWRNLAYITTKDMVHRPQRSRAIAEFLQVSVNELLLLIQTHALPWLVLDRKNDVIQRIAEARQEKEIWRPLVESTNLASILSLLLIQDTDNIEGFTKSRLNDISPHFHSLPLLDLLQSEPVFISMELLKAAGDADAAKKTTVRKALHAVATMILGNSKETRSKKGDIIGHFLQPYLLGLMPRFTDVINDTMSTPPPVLEQLRCIRAVDEMLQSCRAYARIARPQISACLLSALPQDSLREAAFTCWSRMLLSMEEEDVEALLETTFFIVHQYWHLLDDQTTETVNNMLGFVLDSYEGTVTKNINKLPSLSKLAGLATIESRLNKLRPQLAPETALDVFSQRLSNDNSGVVQQALLELIPFLRSNQSSLRTSAMGQRQNTIIAALLRSLLDCATKYNGIQVEIPRLSAECIGLIGCLDYNQVETVREQRSIVVLNNFESSEEVADFGIFLLQEVLVPAFLSAADTKIQGFLSFAMQEILDRCDIKAAYNNSGTGMVEGRIIYQKWMDMPDHVREVLTPFISSRYMITAMAPNVVNYPIFQTGKPYAIWLRSFTMDLLQHGQNPHADMIFEPLTRVIRVKDLSTAEFLLPYLVLHILLGTRSSETQRSAVLDELLMILQHAPGNNASYAEREDMKRYCHSVFRVLDYAMRWVQHKRSSSSKLTSTDKENLSRVQHALDAIPAQLTAQRAIDCNEYARALFHLEQHVQKMEQQKREPGERVRLLEQLQDIYANIDEPDGMDGISAHLPALDINQQILSHKKAGRWTAAQTWYEMQLAEKPDNVDVQVDLLNCLKQAGQHDVLLNHVEGMRTASSSDNRIMPFAVEAAWVSSRWESLEKFMSKFHGEIIQDFNVSVAGVLASLRRHSTKESLVETLQSMREKIASSMNSSATASLQAAHDILLKCHVLTDLEIIIGASHKNEDEHRKTMGLLEARLDVIGAYFDDKQYLLGIQRAAMELMRPKFSTVDVSGLWLSSARLARKSSSLHQSFNAVLHASQLGDDAATIENAKLLWRDSHHRKAIQMLQGAIERNKFMTQTGMTASTAGSSKMNTHQKLLTARAQLLLAKWLDSAGQTHATALREKYQQPPKTYSTWEKGHYYLGRHYKKILESEKPLKVDDQSDNYVTGEIARLVIENYVRSLNSGTKYLYQTLPRILTLWLDLGAQVNKSPEGKAISRELEKRRLEQLHLLHSFLDKYIYRLPSYIFYTALPQIVARIAHPNASVFERLTHIIVKVVEAHPRQALWSLIGIMTTRQMSERKGRSTQILQTLRNISKKVDGASYDLKTLLRMGEKLAEQLLVACQNGDFQGNKTVHASLTRELRFNHKCTPCPLVVPVESSLTATLPAVTENIKKHKAFSRDVVTIDSFLDNVLVLSSLAKPRRLTARGTDGKNYMLLIKPKDDLRTDQRLMEFNGMINRSLKRDAESSRRQLYIRTYAVVPLNEECGIIEWVPGIKTMRDILLGLYSSAKIFPDYMNLKTLMEEASVSESRIRIFTDDVLGRFPPMLHLWFIQQYPNPSTWFAARLRYTRSCAVMSMVGTILGLGDRHGENVLLEEGSGGVFHVDFNCLFDKGLTFAKPERVPFRLTHNMVAAMGIYGYEGPFRKSSELTLSILRQQEETLMTILESFIYDPTLDLQKDKRAHKRGDTSIKLQPQSVVDSIKRKVKGLLPNESIPLGVEGQVEELIKQAVDPRNLTAMYIGWCPFF